MDCENGFGDLLPFLNNEKKKKRRRSPWPNYRKIENFRIITLSIHIHPNDGKWHKLHTWLRSFSIDLKLTTAKRERQHNKNEEKKKNVRNSDKWLSPNDSKKTSFFFRFFFLFLYSLDSSSRSNKFTQDDCLYRDAQLKHLSSESQEAGNRVKTWLFFFTTSKRFAWNMRYAEADSKTVCMFFRSFVGSL